MGVFASRSPFRPNPIGLSSVRLVGIEKTAEEGTVLLVSGVDLLDMTPIYDIKPYLPFADCHPEATAGYAGAMQDFRLQVLWPEDLRRKLPPEKQRAALECLAEDPRPAYHDEPERIYSMRFAEFDIRFTVQEGKLTVTEVETLEEEI